MVTPEDGQRRGDTGTMGSKWGRGRAAAVSVGSGLKLENKARYRGLAR